MLFSRVRAIPVGSQAPVVVAWRPFLALVGALALAGALGLAATAYVALRTALGSRLDEETMDAVSSPELALDRLHEGLRWISVGSVGLSLLVCLTLAALRLRLDLALGAVVVIGGSNVTTQILKYEVFTRPELSPGPNGLPSGHMTVALSIAFAAVIVAPSAWRSAVAIGVSATAALVGVALFLGRWHRPSDVFAAVFVALVWAAVGLLVSAMLRHCPASDHAGGVWVHVGAIIGATAVGVLLLSWGVRPQPGMRDFGLGVISLGAIGLAAAFSVGAVAHVANRHLG